jgi:hypothetical protein
MPKILKYILSVESLKQLSLIENNVEAAKLTVMMQRVQKTYLEPVLGTPLYKKLLNDIETDNVSGIYETLLNDYVIDFYVYACELEYIVSGSNKQMNMGSATYQPQNTQQNDNERNNDVRDNIKKHMANAQNSLVGFLLDNKTDIPEYLEHTKNYEDVQPDTSASIVPTFGLIKRRLI